MLPSYVHLHVMSYIININLNCNFKYSGNIYVTVSLVGLNSYIICTLFSQDVIKKFVDLNSNNRIEVNNLFIYFPELCKLVIHFKLENLFQLKYEF